MGQLLGSDELIRVRQIRPKERDYALQLHETNWPMGLIHPLVDQGANGGEAGRSQTSISQVTPSAEYPTWKNTDESGDWTNYLHRTIPAPDGAGLWEAIIRFPSAPVYGIHRKYEYQYPLNRINYHTMRILRRPWAGKTPGQIKHVYLLLNGLNETDDLGFYYALADLLIKQDDCACLIRPFPGHLTRYPFISNFAEKPLDRYLADAGDLFRQFLRYMIETQWLLSGLVPQRSYRVAAGLDLLEEGDETGKGRADHKKLACSIYEDWERAFNASAAKGRETGTKVTPGAIETGITTIRSLLGWAEHSDVNTPPVRGTVLHPPALHVVGYSLGGFLAQSLFFTWPFAISSCSTLCSGGALRDVALTAFAHPEEWQTVMHALKYELESAMIDGRLSGSNETITGIKSDYFAYFERIFYEVFLQDFRGSYRSRVSEYVMRLLFIVGGNDPIITPRSVLDASPPEGINLVEIANLSHFLWPMKKRDEEREWREFWLPQVAGLIGAVSNRAELILARTLTQNWWNKERTRRISPDQTKHHQSSQESSHEHEFDVALSSPQFEAELDALVHMLSLGGWVFIFRNDLPVALLGPRMLHRRGTALHHVDDRIGEYLDGLQRRGRALSKAYERVTIVIPKATERWFTRQPPLSSPKSETAGGRLPSPEDLEAIWSDFSREWVDARSAAVRFFDPTRQHMDIPLITNLEKSVRLMLGIEPDDTLILNTLPDVWIAVSSTVRQTLMSIDHHTNTSELGLEGEGRTDLERGFLKWTAKLAERREHPTDQIKTWLKDEELRIIRVSASEFNPRFRGKRIRNVRTAQRLIVHCALAYSRSTPMAMADAAGRGEPAGEGEAAGGVEPGRTVGAEIADHIVPASGADITRSHMNDDQQQSGGVVPSNILPTPEEPA